MVVVCVTSPDDQIRLACQYDPSCAIRFITATIAAKLGLRTEQVALFHGDGRQLARDDQTLRDYGISGDPVYLKLFVTIFGP